MKRSPTKSFARAATLITTVLILSRVLGYVREALIAARFGASHVTDAYVVALDYPNSAAIGAGLMMVLIPIYKEIVQNRDKQQSWRFVSTMVNLTALILAVLVGGAWLAAPLLPRLVPGLPPEAHQMAVGLTRIMLPMLLATGVGGVTAAVLNANRAFLWPAVAPLIGNVGVVATLLIIRQPSQITWLAWAVALGALAGTVAQFAWLHRLGFRFRWAIDWHDPAIRMVGRLLLPAMLTIGVVQLHNAVDRFLASYLSPGSIATLNYAQLVNALPYGVAGVAVVTVLYPNLAEYAAKGERTDFYRVLIDGIRTLAFVLLPMAFGLLLFRGPIIRLLFQRGAFDQQATAATASVLQYATIGILFVGVTDLLNRSFFALKDTLTPMWVAFVAVLVHFLLNLLFVRSLGTGGLALSASLAALVAVGLLLWRLQQRLGALPWASLLRSVATSLATALVGGALGFVVSKLVGHLVSPAHSVGMLVQIGSGLGTLILVHISLTLLVGGPDHDRFTDRIRQKLSGR